MLFLSNYAAIGDSLLESSHMSIVITSAGGCLLDSSSERFMLLPFETYSGLIAAAGVQTLGNLVYYRGSNFPTPETNYTSEHPETCVIANVLRVQS